MRYTKELQKKVRDAVEGGLEPQRCAEKYGIPLELVVKWSNLDVTEQRAGEIAIRKYQTEVSETEAEITGSMSVHIDSGISDGEYLGLCKRISRSLYSLVANVVKKERHMAPAVEKELDGESILKTARKWTDNPFIRRFAQRT